MADRPLRIACFSPYPETGPSVRHRVLAFREQWAEAGIELTFWPFMSTRLYAIRREFSLLLSVEKLLRVGVALLVLVSRILRVRSYDVVIIHREAAPVGGALFESLIQKLNSNVVFDFDDALWLPPSNPVDQRRLFRTSDTLPAILRGSRAVVAGNEYLAKYARRHSANVHVIPTAYRDLAGRVSRNGGGGNPIVIWIGSIGNAAYLLPILPVLERVATEHPFVLRLVGGADLRDIRSTALAIEYLTWREEDEAQWLRESDIGIMPLCDREYERGKCAFKLIQYFSAALPVVASPVGMNVAIVRDGVNGYLADQPEEWAQHLRTLLRDPEARRRMGDCGQALFRSDFSRDVIAPRWKELIGEVAPPRRRG